MIPLAAVLRTGGLEGTINRTVGTNLVIDRALICVHGIVVIKAETIIGCK